MNYRQSFKALLLFEKRGNPAVYDFAQDISSIQQSQQMLVNFVEPVIYGPIKFIDGEEQISYTDCVEISLLRFLHLMFSDGKRIVLERVKKYMDESKLCQELLSYMQKHQDVMLQNQDYEEGKPHQKERSEWCVFLNQRPFLKYKKEGKYQVTSCIQNIIAFFANFFPKLDLKFEKDEDKLNQILRSLSFDYKLRCTLHVTLSNESSYWYKMQNLLKIYVNENNLVEWMLYQYFLKDENCTRQTGHSDYRFSPHVEKLKQMKEIQK